MECGGARRGRGFFTKTPKNLEVDWIVSVYSSARGIGGGRQVKMTKRTQIGRRMADEAGLVRDQSDEAHVSPEAKLAHRFSAGRMEMR
jgi:hypothetical protein